MFVDERIPGMSDLLHALCLFNLLGLNFSAGRPYLWEGRGLPVASSFLSLHPAIILSGCCLSNSFILDLTALKNQKKNSEWQ